MSTCLSDQPKRVARKAHQCFYCGNRIEIGEVHGYRTGVDGGDFWTMRYHPECEAFAVAQKWGQDEYMFHEPGCEFERPAKVAKESAP